MSYSAFGGSLGLPKSDNLAMNFSEALSHTIPKESLAHPPFPDNTTAASVMVTHDAVQSVGRRCVLLVEGCAGIADIDTAETRVTVSPAK